MMTTVSCFGAAGNVLEALCLQRKKREFQTVIVSSGILSTFGSYDESALLRHTRKETRLKIFLSKSAKLSLAETILRRD